MMLINISKTPYLYFVTFNAITYRYVSLRNFSCKLPAQRQRNTDIVIKVTE